MAENKENFDEDDLNQRSEDEDKIFEDQFHLMAKAYLDVWKSKPERYYVINPEQSRKFDELVDFFKRIAEEQEDVVITYIKNRPEGLDGCGRISVEFEYLDLSGDDMLGELIKIISYTSAICITALTTGEVCLNITVPDVFIEQED